MTIGRRKFLHITMVGTAAGISARVAGAASVAAGDAGAHWALATPQLLPVLGAERVRALGARYREATPSENDSGTLVAALDGAGLDTSALVARDFAEDRTLLVDGWLLSITEARQCALFSLLVG